MLGDVTRTHNAVNQLTFNSKMLVDINVIQNTSA